MNLQKKIISEFGVDTKVPIDIKIKNIINFLKNYLQQNSFKTYILGISGGQDSTLAGKLAELAVQELRVETKNTNYKFIAIRLPYGIQLDESDAQLSLNFIKPDSIFNINIKSIVDELNKSLINSNIYISDFNLGNVKARVRMSVQYAIAAKFNGLVIGTSNADEELTGFFTKYGDGSSDIKPLYHLDKRQIIDALYYLNAPDLLCKKIPTADLENDNPGFPDEKALGIKYDLIDDFLEGKNIDDKSLNILLNLYNNSKHKRNMPAIV